MPKVQFAGISFTAPESYVDRSICVYAAPGPPGQFQRNVTLAVEPRMGRDPKQIIRDVEQQLLHMRQPAMRFGAKGPVRIGGRDGASIEYASDEMLPIGPMRLVRRLVFVPIDDDRLLVVTFTAADADFATHVAELEAMLASFQV